MSTRFSSALYRRHGRLPGGWFWLAAAGLCLAAPALTVAQGVPMPVPPVPVEAAPPPVPPVKAGEIRSLFYSPEDLKKIKLALNSYLINSSKTEEDVVKKEEDDDFLNKLIGTQKKEPGFYTYPQFFLESLVYHTPTDWAIRVNNRKLDVHQKQFDDLRVVDIDKNQVWLEWTPDAMEQVIKTLRKNKPSSGVKVDRQQKKVVFPLHANQTFSSYVMQVLEGKVLPVTVKNTPKSVSLLPTPESDNGNGEDSMPDLSDAGAGTEGVPADSDENKEGLMGLIGAYKKLGKN